MATEILLLIIGAALTFGFGVILAKIKRSDDKADKREEKRQAIEEAREADRDEREELILECINANFCITKELVDCVLYEKPPNGELKEAFDYKQETKHRLEDYMRRRAAR